MLKLTNYNLLHKDATLKQLMQIALGILLLFACSQISIPLQPVPITLQTVAVMLIALTYNQDLGLKTIISYISLGALGAPVFAGFSGGISILFGPTGGYLFGFIAAVLVIIYTKRFLFVRSFIGALIACLIGNIVIFACGITWLSTIVGFEQAIKAGLLPFILPGIIKSISLAMLLRTIHFFRQIN
jgi:biotin transport system substrate-specific component